jgi:hypothetical protein
LIGAWRRLGPLALDRSRGSSWALTHAALPVTEPVADGLWNVYLSLRDSDGRARIGRAQLIVEPRPTLSPLEGEPILDIGELGAFDDSGVVTSCLQSAATRRYLFYTGWSRGVTVPFYLAAGLAISDEGGPFRRISRAPVLERLDAEPFLTASPFVLHDGPRWRMWYVSSTGWMGTGATPEPCYHIRYAESTDGMTWDRPGRVCVDYGPNEHAFGRPWVVRDDNLYRMWFSVRGDRYRIGYAESVDGITWERADQTGGLAPSDEGWDSEMVEYPCLFDYRGHRYMLYNGNDYGRTGVGVAIWEHGRAAERQ